MIEAEEIRSGIWTFHILLPDNPLKWLNCYVIKGKNGGRNLLIDTGFRREECTASLLEGMKALELRPEETDVFMTHLHSDHTGNASLLQSMGCGLIMGEHEYRLFEIAFAEERETANIRALTEGLSSEMMAMLDDYNPAVLYRTEPFSARCCKDGDTLSYGGYTFRCVFTPGHTPGHMCLYAPDDKIMFLGDHVLFDITPNICAWPQMEDSLGTYLDSLQRINSLEVELALPGHRNTGSATVQERIAQLTEHHRRRLDETVRIIEECGEINAYDIAGKMTWRIRARNWDEFPLAQKWFAFGETLAHLDYHVKRGNIRRLTSPSGNVTYCHR